LHNTLTVCNKTFLEKNTITKQKITLRKT